MRDLCVRRLFQEDAAIAKPLGGSASRACMTPKAKRARRRDQWCTSQGIAIRYRRPARTMVHCTILHDSTRGDTIRYEARRGDAIQLAVGSTGLGFNWQIYSPSSPPLSLISFASTSRRTSRSSRLVPRSSLRLWNRLSRASPIRDVVVVLRECKCSSRPYLRVRFIENSPLNRFSFFSLFSAHFIISDSSVPSLELIRLLCIRFSL